MKIIIDSLNSFDDMKAYHYKTNEELHLVLNNFEEINTFNYFVKELEDVSLTEIICHISMKTNGLDIDKLCNKSYTSNKAIEDHNGLMSYVFKVCGMMFVVNLINTNGYFNHKTKETFHYFSEYRKSKQMGKLCQK